MGTEVRSFTTRAHLGVGPRQPAASEGDPRLGVHLDDGRRCAASVPRPLDALRGRKRRNAHLDARTRGSLDEKCEQVLDGGLDIGSVGRARVQTLAQVSELGSGQGRETTGHAASVETRAAAS